MGREGHPHRGAFLSAPANIPCPRCGADEGKKCRDFDAVAQRCNNDKVMHNDMCDSVTGVGPCNCPNGKRSIDKRVQACLHACEGLATVDLASNEKGWLTDVVFKAAAVENDLEHYRRIVRRQDHGEAYDTLRRVNLDLSAQIAKLEAHQSAMTAREPNEDDLNAIEDALGMAKGGWGDVNGLEIIRACWKRYDLR